MTLEVAPGERHDAQVSSFLTGVIPKGGIVEMLADVESTRVTGVLSFVGPSLEKAPPARGEVSLVLGQIAAVQADSYEGEDPLEVLLALRGGSFEILQALPPLPVSRGDGERRTGSLAVHIPADLMNYCERAGLTGVLELSSLDRRVIVLYAGGELSSIRLENADELHEVFGWEDGQFVIAVKQPDAVAAAQDSGSFDGLEAENTNTIDPETEPEGQDAEPRTANYRSDAPTTRFEVLSDEQSGRTTREDTTGKLLRVVDVTLSDILREREERRPPTRTSPPLPALPEANAHKALPPRSKRKPRKDQTVRVIYLDGHSQSDPTDVGPPHTAQSPVPSAPGSRRTEKDQTMGKNKKSKKFKKNKNKAGPATEAAKGAKAAKARNNEAHAATETANSSTRAVENAPNKSDATDAPKKAAPEGSVIPWLLAVLLAVFVALLVLSALPPIQ